MCVCVCAFVYVLCVFCVFVCTCVCVFVLAFSSPPSPPFAPFSVYVILQAAATVHASALLSCHRALSVRREERGERREERVVEEWRSEE